MGAQSPGGWAEKQKVPCFLPQFSPMRLFYFRRLITKPEEFACHTSTWRSLASGTAWITWVSGLRCWVESRRECNRMWTFQSKACRNNTAPTKTTWKIDAVLIRLGITQHRVMWRNMITSHNTIMAFVIKMNTMGGVKKRGFYSKIMLGFEFAFPEWAVGQWELKEISF